MQTKKVTITIGDINICIEGLGENSKNDTPEITQELSTPFTKKEYMDFVNHKNLTDQQDDEIGKEIFRILGILDQKERINLIVARRQGKSYQEIGKEMERTESTINARIHSVWKMALKQWENEHRL